MQGGNVDRNLTYTLDTETVECFGCKENFTLYAVQKMGMNFCKVCGVNNKFLDLITLPPILIKTVKFAEQENKKVNDRLVVDVSDLLQYLQS